MRQEERQMISANKAREYADSSRNKTWGSLTCIGASIYAAALRGQTSVLVDDPLSEEDVKHLNEYGYKLTEKIDGMLIDWK